MTILRLLADDLTGALDSAARFVPLVGTITVVWSGLPPAGSVAIDNGTRDLPPTLFKAAASQWLNAFDGADIAFMKIDSLLRGHVAEALVAALPGFDHCIAAPAFPFQNRITRAGRQWVRDGESWRSVGPLALPVPLRDAETEADLDAIVRQGLGLSGRVLWVGTGGLAGALAGHQPVPCPPLPSPILALIGTDHPVTQRQLTVAAAWHRQVDDKAPLAYPAALTVALPSGTPREIAGARIVRRFAETLSRPPRPGTLFVTGGATLRGLCDALGATSLLVDGEIEPGVPMSILQGGDWHGQRIVSKSGAFGAPDLLMRLLGAAG